MAQNVSRSRAVQLQTLVPPKWTELVVLSLIKVCSSLICMTNKKCVTILAGIVYCVANKPEQMMYLRKLKLRA